MQYFLTLPVKYSFFGGKTNKHKIELNIVINNELPFHSRSTTSSIIYLNNIKNNVQIICKFYEFYFS